MTPSAWASSLPPCTVSSRDTSQPVARALVQDHLVRHDQDSKPVGGKWLVGGEEGIGCFGAEDLEKALFYTWAVGSQAFFRSAVRSAVLTATVDKENRVFLAVGGGGSRLRSLNTPSWMPLGVRVHSARSSWVFSFRVTAVDQASAVEYDSD